MPIFTRNLGRHAGRLSIVFVCTVVAGFAADLVTIWAVGAPLRSASIAGMFLGAIAGARIVHRKRANAPHTSR